MSQLQALEIEEIPVEKIKPSPYQPRIIFELEDLRGSIIKYGIQDPLKIRKVGDYYELIDGERRWRIAQQEGLESVPCLILEYSDEEADALAWRFNTERKQYTLEERAKHFRQHQLEGLSGAGIGRIHGYSSQQVNHLLSIFRLPEKYQNYLWSTEFAAGKFEYMYNKGLMNDGERQVPDVTKIIDEAIERRLTQREFENVVDAYLSDLEKREVEAAKKAVVRTEASTRRQAGTREALGEPEVKTPETSEDFERAAKVLSKRAKELKTPEQIHQENVEKAKKTFNRFSLDEAERLGIDVNSFSTQIAEIEAQIEKDPEAAYNESKELKKEINKAIKKNKGEQAKKKREDRERRIREEAAANARAEAQAEADTDMQKVKETVKEEVKEELQQDLEFRARIAQEEREKRLDEFKRKYEIEEPTLEMGKKYHERVVSTFYRIRGWGVPMILSMGEKWWNETIPYVQGINDWTSFILMIKPDKKLEEQPKEPLLKVEIDEDKIVEAEYEVV